MKGRVYYESMNACLNLIKNELKRNVLFFKIKFDINIINT